jgi:type II secretory pathway component GspD/PulD (secretin)
MRITTLTSTAMLAAIALSVLPPAVYAQSSEASVSEHVEGGVPIKQVIAAVSRKSGKKFILDPRVRAEVVLVGQDTAALGFNELLAVLRDYGFAAVEYGGSVHILPDASIRALPVPVISGKDTRPDAEFVSKVITVKNVSAAQLVPILRPLLPQVAHLAAFPCNNRLLIVDMFANVRRIEGIIEALDVGEPYKPPEKCGMQEGAK